MKTALIVAALFTLTLTACDKKDSPPMAPAAPKVESSSTGPAGAMTAEDKIKAVESARSAAKSAGGGKE